MAKAKVSQPEQPQQTGQTQKPDQPEVKQSFGETQAPQPQPTSKKTLEPFEHDGLPVPELRYSSHYCNWHYSIFRPDDELDKLAAWLDELSYLMDGWTKANLADEKRFYHLLSYLSSRCESVAKALGYYHQVPRDLIEGTDLAKLIEKHSQGGAS